MTNISDTALDELQNFLDAQDALDNHELNGINAEDYFVLMYRRNDARKHLDAALASPQVAPASIMTAGDAKLEVSRFENMIRNNTEDEVVIKWRNRLIAALTHGPAKPNVVAAKLVKNINDQAKHLAYMERIDNGDAAEVAEEKLAELVKELAALVSTELTNEQILSAWKHVSVWGWATDDDRIARAKELLAISNPAKGDTQ